MGRLCLILEEEREWREREEEEEEEFSVMVADGTRVSDENERWADD